MGIDYSKGIMKNIIPVVMAGVLGIYGLIVSVIMAQSIVQPRRIAGETQGEAKYSIYNAWSHVSNCLGLSSFCFCSCLTNPIHLRC